MPRKPRKPASRPLGDASDHLGFQNALDAHLEALRVKNYSDSTIEHREKYLRRFIEWCLDRDLARPSQITKPILERFQRHLYHYRDDKGRPLSVGSQADYLSQIKSFFRWLCKNNFILFNPASEIELPKLGQRLPKTVLSAREADLVLAQPQTHTAIGLRDRAILEVFYSCGIRRFELAELTIYSLDAERKTLMVRQGKGKKDRLLPIGHRAIVWIQRYLLEGRPKLMIDPNEKTLFVSVTGEKLEPNSLSETVRGYVKQADIGKTGSCHLFRHTMATLMVENGADIRFVQVMLGHADLSTTEIYTRVSIKKLQQVHELTHPADLPPPDDTAASAPTTPQGEQQNVEPETRTPNAIPDRPSESQPELPKDSTNKPTES